MACWIHGNRYSGEPDQVFDSIIKARATAVKMLEFGKSKVQNIPIYKSQYGTAIEGNVFKEKGGRYTYHIYDSKYGYQSYGLYKNGKLMK